MAVPTPKSRWKLDESGGSEYVYISGTPVSVGAAGDHDYVISSGSQVQDSGSASHSYVYESGTEISTGGGVSTAADDTGFNDGNVIGGIIGGVEGATASTGTAYEFTNNGDSTDPNYVDVTGATYNFSGGYTLSAWGYLRSSGNVRNLFEDSDDPEAIFAETTQNFDASAPRNAGTSGDVMIFVHKDSSNDDYRIGANYSLNTWILWTFVWDGTDMFLYRDGSLVASNPVSDQLGELGAFTFFIGADSSPSSNPDQNWDGYIDDVRAWEQPLTSSEVGELYASY